MSLKETTNCNDKINNNDRADKKYRDCPLNNILQHDKTDAGDDPVCLVCGSGLPKNSSFCVQCGELIQKHTFICKSCGEKLPLDAKFCLKCGCKQKP
jgi:ribosomal protein L40E